MATDSATRSAIDDVFNDNFSDFENDPFADKPLGELRDDKATLSPRSSLKRKANDDDKENPDLGLDEEVKVVKKRKPIAKLDEARLLSEPGLPVLRKLIREKTINRKLRLKGKGHEFTDAARLLNYFQLWLDNLYPRAKFADALQLVEKAGHTKRMQVVRNEWINEGKPGYFRPEPISIDIEVRDDEMPDLFTDNAKTTNATTETWDQGRPQPGNGSSLFGSGLKDDSIFIPDDDDDVPPDDNEPDDDDDLEALLAMQDDFRPSKHQQNLPPSAEDSEGEDDLDALLAEQEVRSKVSFPSHSSFSGPETTVNRNDEEEDDDLDALLAEQEAFTMNDDDVQKTLQKSRSGDSTVIADDDTLSATGAPVTSNIPETIDPASQGQGDEHAVEALQSTSAEVQIEAEEDSQLRGIEEHEFSSSPIPNE